MNRVASVTILRAIVIIENAPGTWVGPRQLCWQIFGTTEGRRHLAYIIGNLIDTGSIFNKC